MKWYVFLNSVKTSIAPVYVFMGADYSLKSKGEKLISKNFCADTRIKMDSQNSAAEILGELNSESLFSKKKIVTVKDTELFKTADLKSVIGYSKDPNTVLVLFSRWNPKINKFFLENKISPVDCFPPFPDALAREVRNRVKSAGKNIEEDAVRTLLSISRNDSGEIDGNLDKILNFTGDEKTITQETVETVSSGRELNVFEFSRELLSLNKSKKVVQRCEKIDKKDYFAYLGFLTKKFETLLILKGLQADGKTIEDGTLRKFKIIKKDMPHIRKFLHTAQIKTIEKCYKIILETYENIKSGEENAFINAILKISRALGERGKT